MASLSAGAGAQAEGLGELMPEPTTARKPVDRSAGCAALGAGVLVSHSLALAQSAGGLQLCTDEYARALRAAGVELAVTPIEHDRRKLTRLVRRIAAQPYPTQWRTR